MSSLSIGSIFGIYSGIITALGLTLGIYGGGLDKKAHIIGLISIALSDSLSDAYGIYNATNFSINESLLTLAGKSILPMLMVIPYLFMPIKNAIITNIIFSTLIISLISYKLLGDIDNTIINVILTWLVISLVYYVGTGIRKIQI